MVLITHETQQVELLIHSFAIVIEKDFQMAASTAGILVF